MAKNALVLGAAGGVGIQVVRKLVARGYSVMIAVMDAAQQEAVCTAVPEVIEAAIVDMAQADTVAATLAPLLAKASTLDLVAVCAAISPYGPLETTPISSLRRTLEINAISNLAVYQAVMPMLRASGGRMAMISSMAGRVAFPFVGHYSTSKFALEALADVMRREAAKWGVEIILIEPGGIQTTMVTDQQTSIRRDKAVLAEDVKALYGDLYESFDEILHGGFDNATLPDAVAEIMVAALTAPEKPLARYPVGPDAEFLCAASRTMTDVELDGIARLESANDQLNAN